MMMLKRWACVLMLMVWCTATASAQTTPCSVESGANPVTLDEAAAITIQRIDGKDNVFQNPMLSFNVTANLNNINSAPLCVSLPTDRLLTLEAPVVAGEKTYCDYLLASLSYTTSPSQPPQAVREIEIKQGSSVVIEVNAFCLQNNLPHSGKAFEPPFVPEGKILYQSSEAGGRPLTNLGTSVQGFMDLLARIADRPQTPEDTSERCGLKYADLSTQFAVFIQRLTPDEAFKTFYLDAQSWVFARDYSEIYCLLGLTVDKLPGSQAKLSINGATFTAGDPIVLRNESTGGIARAALSLTLPDGQVIPDVLKDAEFEATQEFTLPPEYLTQVGSYRATLITFGAPLGFDAAANVVVESQTPADVSFVVESVPVLFIPPTPLPLTEKPFQQMPLASSMTWQQFLGFLCVLPPLLIVAFFLLHIFRRTLKRVLVRRVRLFLLTLSLAVMLLILAVIFLREGKLL